MISYLWDLMEDATDFSWQGAKAAHAVLLCEMERGGRCNGKTHIGSIGSGSHMPKNIFFKQLKLGHSDKKPCFCKSYQTNSYVYKKGHEVNGRLNRHMCAFCLTLCR